MRRALSLRRCPLTLTLSPSGRRDCVELTTRQGFTLLELMLVSGIILVLVTVSTPIFKRTYADLRISSFAKEMAAVIRFCRERAVFERRNFRFAIDMDKKRYQIFLIDEKDSSPKPLKSRWGRTYHIPDDLRVGTEITGIDLSPDGTATEATIYLENREGTTYTILVEANTGFVRVYDYRRE